MADYPRVSIRDVKQYLTSLENAIDVTASLNNNIGWVWWINSTPPADGLCPKELKPPVRRIKRSKSGGFRSNPFKLPEDLRKHARIVANLLVYNANLEGLPLITQPIWLTMPGYSSRRVRILAVEQGYEGYEELSEDAKAVAVGNNIILLISPEMRLRPKAEVAQTLELTILHELVHIFDPKVRYRHLRHLITEVDYTRPALEEEFSNPAEIDAYMTQMIYQYVHLLDDVPSESLPMMRAALIDGARRYAQQLAQGRGLIMSGRAPATWSALGPSTWRRFIKALVHAVETYQPMPRGSL